MKTIVFASLLSLVAFSGFCQTDAPLIERRGNLAFDRYFILGREVSEREVVKKMKPYKPAHKLIKSSRRWDFASAVITGIGIGSFIPTFYDPSPEITVPLLITGAGLIAIAVPLKKLANRKADEAVELYNSRKLMGAKSKEIHLNVVVNSSGIGLQLIF